MKMNEQHMSGSMQQSLTDYKTAMGEFQKKMPVFGKKFNEFTEQCFQSDSLTQKEKQMIALGISIHAQDEYCMIYHTKGALDQGATEENLLEVVSVATAFGGGAALSQGITVVQQCIDEFRGQTH